LTLRLLRLKNQRHKYDYKPKPYSAGEKITRMVGQGRKVLELGPGPGAVTSLLHAHHCRITAIEVDQAAIDIVMPYCEQVFSGDLNNPEWPNALIGVGQFESIVAADVLEHLYDPWSVLRSLHPLLANGGDVVVSLPHLGHSAVLGGLMQGNFDYRLWGLLDKTHIRFFGIHNIQRLFQDTGYKIVEAEFIVKEPTQTEFARQWQRLSEEAKATLSTSKFGTIYQVVVKAVPVGAPGKGIKIAALKPPPVNDEHLRSGAKRRRVRAYLVSFLGLDTRQRIAEIVRFFGLRR
jgi:2-polyprenyl-3-methyl-5-hydroxy-6-metoxy-1,4-benzoquinol methylase